MPQMFISKKNMRIAAHQWKKHTWYLRGSTHELLPVFLSRWAIPGPMKLTNSENMPKKAQKSMRSEQKTSLKDLHLSLQSPTHRVSEPSIYIHSSCQVQPTPLLFIAICVANGHGVFFGPVTVRNVVSQNPTKATRIFAAWKSEITIGFLSNQLITSFTNKAQLITAHCSPFCTPFLFQLSMDAACQGTHLHVDMSWHLCLFPTRLKAEKGELVHQWLECGNPWWLNATPKIHQFSTQPPPNPGQNSWREFGPPKKYTTKGFFEGWKVDGISKDPTKIQVRCDTWQWMILVQTR